MASVLAQQLAGLQALLGPGEKHFRGKPSLLFDFRKAADTSSEALLAIAQAGLEVLCKADKRFNPFPESLFSRASLSVSRDLLTKEENAQLDANLRAFLHVLTNHFLAPAAFQVLEYCIRRYKVHVYNVSDLFVAALPYHSTPEFARLVGLMQLKATPWEWLAPCQQSGAPPPRQLLVTRCVNDQAVLREVCRGAQALGVAGFVSKTYLAFYAVLLCEVLMATPQVTEDLMTCLLPFLVAGLKESAARDYTAATLMVLTQLLSRATLSQDFLSVVSSEVARVAPDLGASTSLMLLAHMAASQPHLTALPAKTLVLLAEQEDIGQLLAGLAARGAKLEPLLQLLLPSLTQALPAHDQLQRLLLELLHNLPLQEQQVQAAALQLLQAGAKQQGEAAAVRQVLRVLDSRYPDQLDAAINEALQQAAAPAAPAAAAGSKHKKGKQAPADADSVFAFVQRCFHGSRHEVVEVAATDADAAAGQQQQHALTLSLAVSAPASQMRVMALQKLDALCSSSSDDDDALQSTRQLLHSSLLSCLRDEVLAVAATAAAAAGLAEVPVQQQLPALKHLLARAAEQLTSGSSRLPAAADVAAAGSGSSGSGSGREALKAAKAALAAVAAAGARAAAAAAAGDEEAAASTRQAAALLLEHALADKQKKKLARAAVSAAASCSWHPALAVLSSAVVSAALQDGPAAAAEAASQQDGKSKRKKKAASKDGDEPAAAALGGKHAAALALNRAVVAALASAVVAGGGAALLQELSALAAVGGARCHHLVVLALVKAAALTVAAGGAQSVSPDVPPPTPSRGRHKGKQHARISSSSQDGGAAAAGAAGGDSAAVAHIAAALFAVLERQLALPAAASGRASKKKKKDKAAAAAAAASDVLPEGWEAAASELLDADSLPSKQHLQQLHSRLQQVNAALLVAGVRSALVAAPADALAHLLGQPVALFARLAAAAAAAAATPAAAAKLLDIMQLLVSKAGQSSQQQLQFLASIYGLPAGSCCEAAQLCALQLLHRQPGSGSGAVPAVVAAGSLPAAAPDSGSWLVQLLAAADSSSKAVRDSALDALLALPGLVAGSSSSKEWQLPGGFAAEQLEQLVSGLAGHEGLLRDSAGALMPLLCSTVASTAMDVDGCSGGGARGRGSSSGGASSRARRGKAGAGARGSAAGDDEDAATAELHLPAACTQALLQLLTAVLPVLHEEAQLLAASLAAAVLSGSTSADDDAAAAVASAASQLLQQLVAGLCGHDSHVAAVASKPAVQQPGWQLLAGDAAEAADAAAEQQKLRTANAAALLLFFTPAALQAGDTAALTQAFIDLLQLPFVAAADGTFGAAVAGRQGDRLSDAQLAAVAPVRAAALHQLDAALFGALPAAQRQAVFTAALTAHTTDGDSSCRAAARAALEQLPVDAGMLLALLCKVGSHAAGSSQQQQHKAKRSRRASSASQADVMDVDAAAGPVLAADLDAATAALELLLWKEEVADRQQLVQPMQQLLRQLIPLMGSIAEPHREGLGQDEEQQEAAGDADTSAGADADTGAAAGPGLASPSAAGYAASLVLLVLRLLAQEQQQHAAAAAGGSSRRHKAAASASGIDAALVLSCASAAADGAVRNAALQLLTVMAQLAPEDMLGHVLQALSVVQQSAALQEDSYSQAVAAATLAALVPAWLEAGRGSQELWDSLIGALPGLPAPRRLALLEALLAALPEELGLPVGLLLMMRRVVAPHASGPAPEAAAAGSSKTPSKGKKTAAAAAPAAAAAVEAGQEESQWLPDLMAALCEKVEVPQRLQAFSAVLQSSLDAADSQAGGAGNGRAYLALPRLAVTFVSANLKAKSVLAAARAPAAAAPVQPACQAIMSAALQHLQSLNPQAAASAAAASPSKSARRTHKAIRAAAAGVYELLSSLEAVQDCSSYLAALVEMSRHDSASVTRRALKLLAARLARAAVDLADAEAAAEQLPAAEQAARLQQLARAGLGVCGELPRLLQAEQPLSRQLALVAADAGIRQFGHVLPAAVLDSLPAVVAAVKDPSAPVRVSALVCIAAGIAAVGQKLVPLLPATAAAVMEAAQEACRDLAGFSHARHAAQQEVAAAASDEAAAAAASDSDDEEEAEAGGSAGADAALQLAGALAALEALVAALGPFLSPYLKPLLQLLLHREVLACSTAGAAGAASRLRAALPAKIPPRLLLEPLISQWDYALSACDGSDSVTAEPAVALLGLVAAMASSMEPSAAATYHEQLLGLLLRALDTRHRWLAGPGEQQRRAAEAVAAGSADAAAAAAAVARLGAGEVAAIESAAVAALSAVVMKLSESRFKPMFLRMVEWANASSSGSTAAAAGTAASYGRAAAFLAAVDALGHRLRAVFAPYHRYFSVLLMRHLADDGLTASAAGGKRPKKKRKSTAAAAGDDDAGAAAAGAVDGSLLSGWLARLRAVRAVHLLALHEPPGSTPAAQQEQQERYDRLVPLLVEQLSEGPPPPVAALLAEQEPDALLDVACVPVAALGAAGKAAVEAGGGAVLQATCDSVGTAALGALLQIASAGGSDVVWKPLHHALLMATRGGSVRAKLLVLGGVSRLAELLREEYLMLLPEALPFVAELMEDGEVAVEGAVQGLVAQLEALSGERLEQYLKA